ncbi:histidyl-tRNA synthetase, class IIA [Asticcacaulis biprosthecium C19]|uniref:Histidyl-tRNA synthetase, class IIA n=1 Tax=Asticcacaulis biprosthecium C19 TaxID=715226 RepID=F4QI86_9CAUL|nr:DUF6445 family protein [Asticcacaulis biprosthecium]EGF91724.1 histidyl-tRNA synthetase, class IIA [Asticcacaulis biprosthecium C19]
MKIQVKDIGIEGHRVVIVDDAVPHAEGLVRVAAARVFAPVSGNSYPGLRHDFTPQSDPEWSYITYILKRYGPIMQDTFGFSAFRLASAAFSLMTRRPHEAHPMTRIPHYDEVGEAKYALLHFLTPQPQGGTAFFRHRRTGFERISAERKAAFHEGLRQDLAAYGEPAPGFMAGSNEAYEQTAYFEGRFNRLLIYSGALLHSAQVPSNFTFSANPAKGRLTTNLFLNIPAESQPPQTGADVRT